MPKSKHPKTDGSWILEETEQDSLWSSESEAEHVDDASHLAQISNSLHTKVASSQARTPVSTTQVHGVSSRSLRNSRSAEPALIMPTIKGQSVTSSRKPKSQSSPRQRVPVLKKADSVQAAVPIKVENSSMSFSQPSATTHVPSQIASLAWSHCVFPILQFGGSVFALLYRVLKPILVFIVAIWVMGFVGRLIYRRTISRALAPLCLLPGSAHFSSFCVETGAAGSVEFNELITVQSAFEDVLASSASGANVPLEMKRGEASIRDLKHVVQYSSLPSRNELVFEFTGFIDTARQASADLTKFNSRIGRAVDRVIGVNRWTLQVIDGIAQKETSRGAVNRFFQDTVLVPFFRSPAPDNLVLEQYLQHTQAVEDQIAELIIEAQALLAILQNLDDRLDVIQSISTRDGVSLKGSRDEMFSQLWTWVGGNRASLKKNNEQKDLLKQVNVYRKTAWEHVSGTILKLQSIANGLEDLRERMGAPNVLGIQATSLKLHIEHIQMGVERLEEQRAESRRVEGSNYRNLLDR